MLTEFILDLLLPRSMIDSHLNNLFGVWRYYGPSVDANLKRSNPVIRSNVVESIFSNCKYPASVGSPMKGTELWYTASCWK
jgi:hypothetical protein